MGRGQSRKFVDMFAGDDEWKRKRLRSSDLIVDAFVMTPHALSVYSDSIASHARVDCVIY
jgi:hypothetical protein